MKQELFNLIASALNLETKNKYHLEENFMTIFLPQNRHVVLTIKKCSNFVPQNHYTTNNINKKIGYGKNNPFYNKIMLKNVKDVQYYVLDMLNTIINYAIKFLFIEQNPTHIQLLYSL